jgi:hypothetical protein
VFALHQIDDSKRPSSERIVDVREPFGCGRHIFELREFCTRQGPL